MIHILLGWLTVAAITALMILFFAHDGVNK